MPARPAPFLQARAPSRAGLGGAVEGRWPWYGRADRGAQEGRPCVLGHARSLPASGKQLADTAPRAGGAARWPDPAGSTRLAGALARLGHADQLLRPLALALLHPATPPQTNTRSLRRTAPGLGDILSRGRLSAIPASARVPRGQDGVAACRRGTGATASAGTRYSPSGPTSGTASRQWAGAAAAVVGLRDPPAGQTSRPRGEQKHGPDPAVPGLAPPLSACCGVLCGNGPGA
jgi:hypothetical protein